MVLVNPRMWPGTTDTVPNSPIARGALRRQEKTALARERARQYDWPLVMRRLVQHYDDLRARSRATGRRLPPPTPAPLPRAG